MRLRLVVHPASSAEATVIVSLVRAASVLQLKYEIEAAEDIAIPPPRAAAAQRCDELWRHTCCELFAAPRPAGGAYRTGGAYREFNFAPMGDWAAYDFDAPRSGMRATALDEPPQVRATLGAPEARWSRALVVEVRLLWSAVGEGSLLWPTVVLETRSGPSFWALRHHGPQPDFHRAENFSTAVGVT